MKKKKPQPPPKRRLLERDWPWLVFLAILTILPLGRELFSTKLVLSDQNTDVALHFLFSRAFGFGEMAQGNFPLWNPYIYGGIPYLGEFQSALLYPLNVIFLVLPLATALNWSFGLHVFLLGVTMYYWARVRELERPAAAVAGMIAMLGGAFYLHIYAGHLSNVCAMAWAPVVFLGIDGWLKFRHGKWIIWAAAAVALQIYAGHPQYVYYTALVAGAYSLIHLIGTPRPVQAAVGLLPIYPLAILLSAAQLLPSILATGETIRSGGVSYEFAAMFSFPPENFVTLFVPWFFGNMQDIPYWGRCYLWEMSLFAGCAGTLLALLGLTKASDRPKTIRLLIFLFVCAVLALGAHTPLHYLLFKFLPGFSSFRGSSKFIIFAGLTVALLAGMGFDRLLKRDVPSLRFSLAGLGLGAALLVIGLAFSRMDPATFLKLVAWEVNTHESYFNPGVFEKEATLRLVQSASAGALLVSGGLFLLASGLLWGARYNRAAVYVLGALSVCELLAFAHRSVASFPLERVTFPAVANFLQQNPGDYRTLNLFDPDASMMLRTESIWGYDPAVLKRWAQLVSISQGADPENAKQDLSFSKPHAILNLLRCRFALVPKEGGQIDAIPMGEPFPRFYFVSKYEAYPSSKEVFHQLQLSAYGLKEKVLLEQKPEIEPDTDGGKQEIKVLSSSTDECTLELYTEHAAILVITDAYAKDWKVKALSGSTQDHYTLLPADGGIRAIPLKAGKHVLRMAYQPLSFLVGILLTLLSLAGVLVLFLVPVARDRLAFPPQAA